MRSALGGTELTGCRRRLHRWRRPGGAPRGLRPRTHASPHTARADDQADVERCSCSGWLSAGSR
eukprot:769135-Pyramimonas_sp.AAC.1